MAAEPSCKPTVGLTFGWAKAASDNAATLLGKVTDAVIAKINGSQQANQAVQLPNSVPSGYGGGLTNDQSSKLSDLWAGRLTATQVGYMNLLTPIKTGLDNLLSMTEVVSSVRRFLAPALSQAPAASGGGSGGGSGSGTYRNDVNYIGVTPSQRVFPKAGRQVLSITINATGADYPVRTSYATMYVGTTSASATSAPLVEDCQEVTPTGDGTLVKVAVMVGTPKGNETLPFFDLAPGTYKFWLIVDDGIEEVPMPTDTVTYDSTVHGSFKLVADRTNRKVGVASVIGEKAWIRAYVIVRREWLANHSNALLHKTVYRMDAFRKLLDGENWNLDLPLTVRDCALSVSSLGLAWELRLSSKALGDCAEVDGSNYFPARTLLNAVFGVEDTTKHLAPGPKGTLLWMGKKIDCATIASPSATLIKVRDAATWLGLDVVPDAASMTVYLTRKVGQAMKAK